MSAPVRIAVERMVIDGADAGVDPGTLAGELEVALAGELEVALAGRIDPAAAGGDRHVDLAVRAPAPGAAPAQTIADLLVATWGERA